MRNIVRKQYYRHGPSVILIMSFSVAHIHAPTRVPHITFLAGIDTPVRTRTSPNEPSSSRCTLVLWQRFARSCDEIDIQKRADGAERGPHSL